LSFDPIAYHVLAWLAIRLFGAGAFAIRLPALLGFLLMQICLFFFVRQVASERAAVFALAYPALGGALYYSAEGRPYGLLLGFCALAMVSWQTATRSESKRTLALVTLALSTALALNTHYYGVLLLVPLCGAEMFRTFQRRRLDFPVIAAIGAGMAWIVFTLPFMKAARAWA
jgi:4-amino-4-deoxy-L-arabinose transferase-like glycosyltransferase